MANQAVNYMTGRLAELKLELEQIEGKADRVKAEMEWLVAGLSAYRKFSGNSIPELEEVNNSKSKSLQKHKTIPSPRRRGIQQPELVPLVHSIILKHGRPMESDEILVVGKGLGRRMGGTRENRDLAEKLKKASKYFKYIGGAGFWPIDVPCPAVGYVPAELVVKT